MRAVGTAHHENAAVVGHADVELAQAAVAGVDRPQLAERRHGAVAQGDADQPDRRQRDRRRERERPRARSPRRLHDQQDLPQREQRADDAQDGRQEDVRQRELAAAEHGERHAAQRGQQRQRRPDAAIVDRLGKAGRSVAPQWHTAGPTCMTPPL